MTTNIFYWNFYIQKIHHLLLWYILVLQRYISAPVTAFVPFYLINVWWDVLVATVLNSINQYFWPTNWKSMILFVFCHKQWKGMLRNENAGWDGTWQDWRRTVNLYKSVEGDGDMTAMDKEWEVGVEEESEIKEFFFHV